MNSSAEPAEPKARPMAKTDPPDQKPQEKSSSFLRKKANDPYPRSASEELIGVTRNWAESVYDRMMTRMGSDTREAFGIQPIATPEAMHLPKPALNIARRRAYLFLNFLANLIETGDYPINVQGNNPIRDSYVSFGITLSWAESVYDHMAAGMGSDTRDAFDLQLTVVWDAEGPHRRDRLRASQFLKLLANLIEDGDFLLAR